MREDGRHFLGYGDKMLICQNDNESSLGYVLSAIRARENFRTILREQANRYLFKFVSDKVLNGVRLPF